MGAHVYYKKINEEEMIIKYLKTHHNSLSAKMERILQIEQSELLRRFSKLIDNGIINRTGVSSNITYYVYSS